MQKIMNMLFKWFFPGLIDDSLPAEIRSEPQLSVKYQTLLSRSAALFQALQYMADPKHQSKIKMFVEVIILNISIRAIV